MKVLKFYITPLVLNHKKIVEKTPQINCECWEMALLMCPGDKYDDMTPTMYMSIYLWVTAEQPVTHKMLDDWIWEHFDTIDIESYKKHW